jgi:hypothetical protein
MSADGLTQLQHELNSLMPGEVRERHARITDSPANARFFRANPMGEALYHHPIWTNQPKPEAIPNRTPRPLIPHLPELPPVSLTLLEPPVFAFSGTEREFGHLYRFGWAALMAEPMLECMLELDSYSIEFVPVTIIDLVSRKAKRDFPRCFLAMPRRAIDCIDTERTSVTLSYLEPLPDITKPMRMCSFEDYVIRPDMPEGVHVFSNVFNADLIFSIELIEAAAKAGVWGIWARRTERSYAEQSLHLYGNREPPT